MQFFLSLIKEKKKLITISFFIIPSIKGFIFALIIIINISAKFVELKIMALRYINKYLIEPLK